VPPFAPKNDQQQDENDCHCRGECQYVVVGHSPVSDALEWYQDGIYRGKLDKHDLKRAKEVNEDVGEGDPMDSLSAG